MPRLSWAIGAAAARVPWRSDCLLQAMAADRWLRRCGMQPEFFLGVTKDAGGQLEAHAWLRCGDAMVTGADDSQLHQPYGADLARDTIHGATLQRATSFGLG